MNGKEINDRVRKKGKDGSEGKEGCIERKKGRDRLEEKERTLLCLEEEEKKIRKEDMRVIEGKKGKR